MTVPQPEQVFEDGFANDSLLILGTSADYYSGNDQSSELLAAPRKNTVRKRIEMIRIVDFFVYILCIVQACESCFSINCQARNTSATLQA
jgi:hypothetical protein